MVKKISETKPKLKTQVNRSAPAKPKQKRASSKIKKYVSVKTALYHPFARVQIPVSPPGVIVEMDSWLESQMKAGFIKEI